MPHRDRLDQYSWLSARKRGYQAELEGDPFDWENENPELLTLTLRGEITALRMMDLLHDAHWRLTVANALRSLRKGEPS